MTAEASARDARTKPRTKNGVVQGGRAHVPLLSAVATLAVAVGLGAGYRGYDPLALALVTAGAFAAVGAAVVGRVAAIPAPTGAAGTAIVRAILALALVAFALSHVFVPPGLYVNPRQPVAFQILAGGAALVAATYLLRLPTSLARWRFPSLVALFVAMAVVVVQASPFPYIDVWWYQQYAGSLIWRGDNPYTFLYPNIYGPGGPFGPDVLDRGMVATFPYPPLTFLLGAPVVTYLEDVRYLLLGAAAAAALVAWRWCTSEPAELAILAFLLQPRAFFVVEQSWTEPLVMAGVAAAVLALVRWRERGRGWILAALAGALLLSSKQYAPLVALPFVPAMPRGRRAVTVGLAAFLAALTFVPFVAWDFREFLRDVILMQVNQPFRTDALSWLVPVAAAVGRPVSAIWGFGAAALVLILAVRNDATPAHAARVSAAALLVFVLFNKQAFCNYYWLVVGLLAVSTSLALTESESGGSRVATPP